MQTTQLWDGGPALPPTGVDAPEEESVPFVSMFAELVAQTNADAHHVGQLKSDFAAGRSDDIHGVMLAASKVGIEMKLTTTIRNKVVDAFYELWRMNV